MLVLLNSTKTMDPEAVPPVRVRRTRPRFRDEAEALTAILRRFSKPQLAREMNLSTKLAGETRGLIARWGSAGESRAPALYAFTGLVYKHVAPGAWSPAQVRDAQRRLVILSGLYGLLRPLDAVAAYRLEMGSGIKPPGAANLVGFWRTRLTAALNQRLRRGEPVLNLAAREYAKALDTGALVGPLISPVFKEIRPDGSLKTAPVYAKMARGALVRHVFATGAKRPADLLGFDGLDWEAACEPPAAGDWLFTRPAGG